MKNASLLPHRIGKNRGGFSLLELIVVITIISMLAVMIAPEWEKIKNRAQSITCVNNLRQIGIGVLAYAGEHDNTYPLIEPNPDDPVYKDQPNDDQNKEEGDEKDTEAKPLLDVLEPYGITSIVLKCPADVRKGSNSYFTQRGCSYQWRITVDGENSVTPMIYGGRRGYGVRVAKPSRVTICTDFTGLHNGRMNRLYADGHVSKPF